MWQMKYLNLMKKLNLILLKYEKIRWKEKCQKCHKKHLWEMGRCPSCREYEVPRLVSENACYHDQKCDMCQSYSDHLQSYIGMGYEGDS